MPWDYNQQQDYINWWNWANKGNREIEGGLDNEALYNNYLMWYKEQGATPPWSGGGAGQGQGGDDWWSGTGEIGPRNRYEEILESLRQRSITDPIQEAQSAASGGPSADALFGLVHGKGVPQYEDIAQELQGMIGQMKPGVPLDQTFMQKFGALQSQANMTRQNMGAYANAMGQAYGQTIGPATSSVGMGYSGLQGFRGQDQQRYLEEMRMEMQLKMLQAQMRAQSQGGGLWGTLGGLAGLAPGIGGLLNLFKPGTEESGGGMQYYPGWLSGGGGRGGGGGDVCDPNSPNYDPVACAGRGGGY